MVVMMMMIVTPISGEEETIPGSAFLCLFLLLRDSPPASTAPCVYCHSIINH